MDGMGKFILKDQTFWKTTPNSGNMECFLAILTPILWGHATSFWPPSFSDHLPKTPQKVMLIACRTETKKQRRIKLNSLFAKVKQKLLEVFILDPLYTELFVYLFLTFQPPWWKFSRCEFLRQGTKFLGICPNGKDTIGSIPVSPWEIWDFFRRRRWGDVIVYISHDGMVTQDIQTYHIFHVSIYL